MTNVSFLPSRNTKVGLETSSTPIDTRRFSPPDIPFRRPPPIIVSAQLRSPKSSIKRSTIASISSFVVDLGRRKRAEKVRAWRGVEAMCKESSCATKANSLRTATCVCDDILAPPRRRSADSDRGPSFGTRPARTLKRLVFPEPVVNDRSA